MKTIVVTGSVGTGKTTYSKKLAKEKSYTYIDVNEIIKKNKLNNSYDKKRKCYIIDVKKLNEILIKIIKSSKKSLVIDSHLAHYLPKKYVDLCIITKCNLKELKDRLKKRKYSKSKIDENLQVEIFDLCFNEAKELGHKIKVINTSR